MRPASTDPDLRKYGRPDDDVRCTECGTWMLPLRDFELQSSSEASSQETEGWEYFVWGLWAFVYNSIYDLLYFEGRKRKLAQLKMQTLSTFPRSLVCPKCLRIQQRV